MRNRTGERYGKLVIIRFVEYISETKTYKWLCRCDCGNEKVILIRNLTSGNTRSCGCLDVERKTTHGMSNTRIYSIWEHIIQRCTNSKSDGYEHYGGRGITVCDSWKVFKNFYVDMGNPPSRYHSIDRVDNNGNYEPNNCIWADAFEQAVNRRNNRHYTLNGETKTVTEWAREYHTNYQTIDYRLNKGWTLEEALTTPSYEQRQKV